MDAVGDPLVEEVTVMKCVRSGGTQAAIDNPIAYFIHQDPGPMLVVQPGKSEGDNWSKEHFDTMVRDSSVLTGLVHSDKIKDRKNRVLWKSFPGGVLHIIGSNSTAGFRGKTIQRVFLDDIDGYEPSAGSEGDQVELARNRTLSYTYHSRKIVKVSNPTTRGLSKIQHEYSTSSQEHYYVPCPFCRHPQFLAFSRRSEFAHLTSSYLRFDESTGGHVYYECENCKKPIEEKYKLQMIVDGRWIPEKPQIVLHLGFHLSEMTSPFTSWVNLVKDFLEAKRTREKLRVFINQRLGETFVEDQSLEVNNDDLRKRLEPYKDVPAGSLVLTAEVDVQGDRLEAIVLGWGLNGECWFIDRRIIVGSPELPTAWADLDRYLGTAWKHESGMLLRPWTTHGLNCVVVDSSAYTDTVYKYVKRNQRRRFYALKGVSGFNKPYIVGLPKLEKRMRARFVDIGVDAIKVHLYDRLSRQRNEDKSYPPGYVHFNENCNEEFFAQLTAEKRIVIRDRRTGVSRWKWVLPSGRRNEVLDLFVYGIAAVTLLDPDMSKLDELMKQKVLDLQTSPEPEEDPEKPSPPPSKPNKPRPRRRPFATNW